MKFKETTKAKKYQAVPKLHKKKQMQKTKQKQTKILLII